MLDQIVGSSHKDLLTCAKQDESLGLPLFEGENVEEPKFVQGVAKKMLRLEKALATLVDDFVNAESSKSTTFLEGFLDAISSTR